MKQHKYALIVSIITTVLSFIGFLCGALLSFSGNSIIKDICAAILSSAIFVIVLSIIGYNIEKSKMQERILTSKFSSGLDSMLSIIDDSNRTNRQGVNTIVIDLITRTISVKYVLTEYYYGLFIKDRSLKDFININLYGFVRMLSELEVYNAYPSRKSDIVEIQLANIIDEYEKISNDFQTWMESAKIKMGKGFDINDNFIAEYEKKTNELKDRHNN